MFLIAATAAGALPTWYLANRVHAHTRLRINDSGALKKSATFRSGKVAPGIPAFAGGVPGTMVSKLAGPPDEIPPPEATSRTSEASRDDQRNVGWRPAK